MIFCKAALYQMLFLPIVLYYL